MLGRWHVERRLPPTYRHPGRINSRALYHNDRNVCGGREQADTSSARRDHRVIQVIRSIDQRPPALPTVWTTTTLNLGHCIQRNPAETWANIESLEEDT